MTYFDAQTEIRRENEEAKAPVDSLAIYDQRHDLQCWFSLSYASWLTLPRVLMEAMPDEWQRKMAELLNEYNETFPNLPDLGTRVLVVQDNKLIKAPSWLLNYRHPDKEAIQGCR